MKAGLWKNKGIVLIMVISMLSAVSMNLLILGRCSGTILFQTDQVYLNAVSEDLAISAVGWLMENAPKLKKDLIVELDVSQLNYKNASINISVEKIEDNSAFVRIDTVSSRGRRMIKDSRICRISLL